MVERQGNSLWQGLRILTLVVLTHLVVQCSSTDGLDDVVDIPYPEIGETVLDQQDPDGDGFPTLLELQYSTDPYNAASHPPDQDGDKIPDAEDDDIDGDGTLNGDDAFPFDADETVDTDDDGVGNNADPDDDGDGFPDEVEIQAGTDPLDPQSTPPDMDGDGVPDATDDDMDGDGVKNGDDAFPALATEWADADGDGQGDNTDPDDDNDGYSDQLEAEYGTDPLDPGQSPADLDQDGIPDGEDLDLDGDGTENVLDAFPKDAAEWADTDGDGIGNNADKDDDGDGYLDSVELAQQSNPEDAGSTPPDVDGDLLPDSEDADIDGDGALNEEDAFPSDATEMVDTDGDGVGNNADLDDDNDGYPDALESASGTDPLDADDHPGDVDGDGIPDEEDLDIDGDDVLNSADAFPYDASESVDTDGDGSGNNADDDDDGDGYPDEVEAALGTDPLNALSHPADMDQDNIPDDQDPDIDGDGVANEADAFPYDPTETADNDGDGQGDNDDSDDDNDGFLDSVEIAAGTDPLDAGNTPPDVDGDLIPDDQDDDIDGDGYANDIDAFPADPTEQLDTDGDGLGNNVDDDDDGDGYLDLQELELGTDPLDDTVHPTDLDGDGIPDPSDPDVDGDGYPNDDDLFPTDPAEWADFDQDGKGDNGDTDDDNDGYPDTVEEDKGSDPKDPNSFPDDLDGDGIPDTDDPDIDGDGFANGDDAFPLDDEEWLDTDGDLVGNNSDEDDDGDGFADTLEVALGTNPLSPFSFPADLDGDKIPDALDPDRDGDGVENIKDAFPNDPLEWVDTDGDGIGNSADEDDDGDGFADDLETSLGYDPLDYDSHPGDLDGDGIPDIQDDDMDGDGIANDQDQFPGNPTEWLDTDGDGIGNNSDLDDDGDGFADTLELDYGTDALDPFSFPADMDGDKIPDDIDSDMDGDGTANTSDAFPEDPLEWLDTDGDGVGNNLDEDDDGDGYPDALEWEYKSDPLDALSTPPDIDGDGIPDPEDPDKDGDGVPNIDDAFPSDPDAWEEVLDEGSFGDDYQDLIPVDAEPSAYKTDRYSLVRGTVLDDNAVPLEGVTIAILDTPEFGSTTTDQSGEFTIPVNGGLHVTVRAELAGYASSQRKVEVFWNDIVMMETIELVPIDPVQTQVYFNGDPNNIMVHNNHADGQTLVMVFTGDNLAIGTTPEGDTVPTDTLVVSGTHYKDAREMPAELPPTTEFTYCAEFRAEGYEDVQFEKPVFVWLPNTYGFAVGTPVPLGFYDRSIGKWIPRDNGVVVELLDLNGDGAVDAVDATGDGEPNDLNGSGLFSDEVLGLDQVDEAQPGTIYWRLLVDHFSPGDPNYPGAPANASPPDADNPNPDTPDNQPDNDNPSKDPSVDVRSRVLHHDVGLPDTDLMLHYASSWAPGYAVPISIPVSGPEVPDSLNNIVVQYSLAGKLIEELLPGEANQSVTFFWDGLDFTGKYATQRMMLDIKVGYGYKAQYTTSSNVQEQARNFAAMGVDLSGVSAAGPITLWREYRIPIYNFQPQNLQETWSMGNAWTLRNYYFYDPTSFTVLRGDGVKITAAEHGKVIETAGADELPVAPRLLDTDSDGNLYFVGTGNDSANRQIWRLRRDGTTELLLEADKLIGDLAIAPDDYIYYSSGSFVYRLRPGWEEPQIFANLFFQFFDCFAYYGDYCQLNIDVTPHGYLYAVGRYVGALYSSKLAIVAPDGVVLANPIDLQCTVFDIVVDRDGLVLAACKNGPVKKVLRDGSLEARGSFAPGCTNYFSYSDPTGLTVLEDGSILVADGQCHRLRKILPDNTMAVISGTGLPGSGGDGEAPLSAQLNTPSDVVQSPDGQIFVADTGNQKIRRIYKVRPVIPTLDDNHLVAIDGKLLVFNQQLQLQQVLDPLSLTPIEEYDYDENGALAVYRNGQGLETSFATDKWGRITEVKGVHGLTTTLHYDEQDQLEQVEWPDGGLHSFGYQEGSLLETITTPADRTTTWEYDDAGRVTKMTKANGATTNFVSVMETTKRTHAVYTPEGEALIYEDFKNGDGWSSQVTTPLGGQHLEIIDPDSGQTTQVDPTGTSREITYALDPVYGTRYPQKVVTVLPSGLTSESYSVREIDLDGGYATYRTIINDNETVQEYDLATYLSTVTTPEGRITTTQFNADWSKVLSSQQGSLEPTTYEFDDQGRVTAETVGDRSVTYDYSVEDCRIRTAPTGEKTTICWDQLTRTNLKILNDDSQWHFEYDQDFGLSKVIAPGGLATTIVYDDVGNTSQYITSGGTTFAFEHNLDGERTKVTYPDNTIETLERTHGVVTKQTIGAWSNEFQLKNDGSERLASAASGDGLLMTFDHDGDYLTDMTYTGLYAATVSHTLGDDFKTSASTINGETIPRTFDNDGLLTSVADYTVTYGDDVALPTGITGANAEATYTYDAFGRIATATWTGNGSTILSYTLTYDASNRVIARQETFQGSTVLYQYEYDTRSRLAKVTLDGNVVEEYAYDALGNRTLAKSHGQGNIELAGAHNNELQLTSLGSTQFTYDAQGAIDAVADNGTNETWDFDYRADGQLRRAVLPDQTEVTWKYDAFGNRVARFEDGNPVHFWIYNLAGLPLARLNSSGQTDRVYIYGTGAVPLGYKSNGKTFTYVTDYNLSVRAVLDEQGNVVQAIDYDSYGNVRWMLDADYDNDFLFGGGQLMAGTGLLKMGVREYAPYAGTFLSRDPLGILAEFHPYAFAECDPINRGDPTGMDSDWIPSWLKDFGNWLKGPALAGLTNALDDIATSGIGKGVAKWAGPIANGIGYVDTGLKWYNGELSTMEAVGKFGEQIVRNVCSGGGATIGAAIGSLGGPVGTFVGGAAGAVVGDLVGQGVVGLAKGLGTALGTAAGWVSVNAPKAMDAVKSGWQDFKSAAGEALSDPAFQQAMTGGYGYYPYMGGY